MEVLSSKTPLWVEFDLWHVFNNNENIDHSLLRSDVIASTIAASEPSFIDVTFHVQSSSLIQII